MWLVIVGPVLSDECAADLYAAISGCEGTSESRREGFVRGMAVGGVAYHPAVERRVLLSAMIASQGLLNRLDDPASSSSSSSQWFGLQKWR